MVESPVISTGTLSRQSLEGQGIIVTGAGGGIGFEAARSLAWLGARVVIAEIDARLGKAAAGRIRQEFGQASCLFVQTDVGDERSVRRLAAQAERFLGSVDGVLNNATVTPMGAVSEVDVRSWDKSYRVNLRGPVLLARAFLPAMLRRKHGMFVCVSSVGDRFMGAYESLKAAQVHLAGVLAAELKDTGVYALTIGPGLVLTRTAREQIEYLAPFYGKTPEEFYDMSRAQLHSAEAAGAAFAAAMALAGQFDGMEIDTQVALNAAGISLPDSDGAVAVELTPDQASEARVLCARLIAAIEQQAAGWAERPVFERQWMQRDFQKYARTSVEMCLSELRRLESALNVERPAALPGVERVERVGAYFTHYRELSEGYLKDPQMRAEATAMIRSWEEDAGRLTELLGDK